MVKSDLINKKLSTPKKILKKGKAGMAIVNVPQPYIPKGSRSTMKTIIREDKRNFFFS